MKNIPAKKSFTIHDLPRADRPRERLQKLGAEALSVTEILALVLGRGIGGESVVVTAQRLIDRFKDIKTMADASIEELSEVRGIGLAKACQIKAAFDLARRMDVSANTPEKSYIRTPEEAYLELKSKSRGQKKEIFWAIFLDPRNKVIKSAEISIGILDASIVHPRELFKEAISACASSVIVAHNHPSGNPEASQDDIKISQRLLEAGRIVGIEVVDHIIIGDGSYISMKREGLI